MPCSHELNRCLCHCSPCLRPCLLKTHLFTLKHSRCYSKVKGGNVATVCAVRRIYWNAFDFPAKKAAIWELNVYDVQQLVAPVRHEQKRQKIHTLVGNVSLRDRKYVYSLFWSRDYSAPCFHFYASNALIGVRQVSFTVHLFQLPNLLIVSMQSFANNKVGANQSK